mgnify:CR=1 FL=1
MRGATVESLTDALSAALALEWASDVMAEGLRRTSLGVIRDHQRASGAFGADGGPPPVYTTALAVLAKLELFQVETIFTQERSDLLLILARSLGLGWPTAKMLLQLRAVTIGLSRAEVFRALSIF